MPLVLEAKRRNLGPAVRGRSEMSLNLTRRQAITITAAAAGFAAFNSRRTAAVPDPVRWRGQVLGAEATSPSDRVADGCASGVSPMCCLISARCER